MSKSKEKAINNTFYILQEFKGLSHRKNFYPPFTKIRLKSPRAECPGKVKIFTRREIFLYERKS